MSFGLSGIDLEAGRSDDVSAVITRSLDVSTFNHSLGMNDFQEGFLLHSQTAESCQRQQ